MGFLKKLGNAKVSSNEAARDFDGLIEVDEKLRNDIQQALLEMYDDAYRVCKEHGLSLYLVGGSALGAVRHGGFIPWDDDLDLAMSRADYNRFRELFESKLGDKYILNAPNYSKKARNRFPKMLKKNTVFRDVLDSADPEVQGLFLDIFVIDNVPDGKLARTVKGKIINFMEFVSGQVQLRENGDELTKSLYKKSGTANYIVRSVVGFLFSYKSASSWFNTIDRWAQHKNDRSRDCNIATGRKHYFGEILPREVYFPGHEIDFNGRKALAFNSIETHLSNLYGDYMKIPPVEKRERHLIREIKL